MHPRVHPARVNPGHPVKTLADPRPPLTLRRDRFQRVPDPQLHPEGVSLAPTSRDTGGYEFVQSTARNPLSQVRRAIAEKAISRWAFGPGAPPGSDREPGMAGRRACQSSRLPFGSSCPWPPSARQEQNTESDFNEDDRIDGELTLVPPQPLDDLGIRVRLGGLAQYVRVHQIRRSR